MNKKPIRVAVFLALLLLLLIGATQLVRPKNNDGVSGIQDVLANGFLSESADTLDVVFLGDSLVHTSFIPMRAWEQYGFTSHICATNGQYVFQSEEFLHTVFQKQHPVVVMLEANHLYKNFEWTQTIAPKAERVLPVFRYHDRWKSLRPEDVYKVPDYTAEMFEKGYCFISEINPADPGDYMAYREGSDPLQELIVDYVRDISQACQKQKAQLVLYSVPSSFNWNSVKHRTVAALAESLGVPYLDMNLLPEEVPIDWQVDTKDAGDHVNYTGACKVTDYLAAWLAREYGLADKRSLPEYAQWNALLEQYHTFIRENTPAA